YTTLLRSYFTTGRNIFGCFYKNPVAIFVINSVVSQARYTSESLSIISIAAERFYIILSIYYMIVVNIVNIRIIHIVFNLGPGCFTSYILGDNRSLWYIYQYKQPLTSVRNSGGFHL